MQRIEILEEQEMDKIIMNKRVQMMEQKEKEDYEAKRNIE